MLGYRGGLNWIRNGRGLTVRLPAERPGQIATVLKITGLSDLAYDGLIYPAMNGDILLGVAAAVRHGQQFVVVADNGPPHVAAWSKSDEWLSWKARIRQPGTYEVSVVSSAAAGASEVTVKAGGGTLLGMFPPTKTWEEFCTVKLGRLTITEAGALSIRFQPASPKTWRALNLASVKLSLVRK